MPCPGPKLDTGIVGARHQPWVAEPTTSQPYISPIFTHRPNRSITSDQKNKSATTFQQLSPPRPALIATTRCILEPRSTSRGQKKLYTPDKTCHSPPREDVAATHKSDKGVKRWKQRRRYQYSAGPRHRRDPQLQDHQGSGQTGRHLRTQSLPLAARRRFQVRAAASPPRKPPASHHPASANRR